MSGLLKYMFLCVAFLTAWSCTRDKAQEDGEVENGRAELLLRLSAPGGYAAPRTRAMTVESENRIEDIYVLLFDESDTLTCIAPGEQVSSSAAGGAQGYSGEGSFSVMLPAGPGVVRLMVLANAGDILGNSVGTDIKLVTERNYDAIVGRLTDQISGALYVDGGVIPMWGEIGPVEIRSGKSNQTVELMRAIARVDVGVGQPMRDEQTDVYTWNGLDKNGNRIAFELTGVYVVRPNDRFSVVPARENRAVDGTIARPSIPGGTLAFTVADSGQKFAFPVDNGLYTSRSIYIPEAEIVMGGRSGDGHHTDRMALVVAGRYNGGSESYYRVDVTDDGKLTDVRRNHLYQFNIAGVAGDGYPDVATAYRSQAMNMTVQVLAWDEHTVNDVKFDGTCYFSLDRRTALFDPVGGQTLEVVVKTNVGNFEMWCDGARRFDAAALAGGATYGGYDYTLKEVKDGEYLLSIHCAASNVSETESVGARLRQWTFRAGKIDMRFDVDQRWMKSYISIADGESTHLMPEGTDGVAIPVDIVSTQPVAVSASAPWVRGVANATFQNGVYLARLKIEVDAFRFGIDGTADRTATITVEPRGEASRRYTIVQEAPYLRMNRTEIYVPRPADTSVPVVNRIEVLTNILDTDLELVRVGGEAPIDFVDGEAVMEGYDSRMPRCRRFEVATDFASALASSYGAKFMVIPDVRYGRLTASTVELRATNMAEEFDIYWRSAYFGMWTMDWAPGRYVDKSTNYHLPWNTRIVEFDVVTNMGVAEIPASSSLGGAVLTQGAPTMDSGLERHPFALMLNNSDPERAQTYSVAMKTLSASGAMRMFDVRLGSREISFTALGDVAAAGYPHYALATVDVRSNVNWRVSSPAAWVRFGTGSGFATELTHDDRLYSPVTDAALLVRESALQVVVDPVTVLNASDRETTVTFVNLDDNNAAMTMPIKQWSPKMLYTGGLSDGNIPISGTTYTITSKTNLQGWSVRAYDVTAGGKVLLASAANTEAINGAAAAVSSSVEIEVPANDGENERDVMLALNCSGYPEMEIGRRKQDTKEAMIVTSRGIPAPPGVLGVGVSSGRLTLRGSNQYAGTVYEANSEFGPLADEPVTVALFKWGSLVATSSDLNNNDFTSGDMLWKPAGYNGSPTVWGDIPHGVKMTQVPPPFPSNNVAQGLGDPCTFADGANGDAPWRIPDSWAYTDHTLPIVNLTLNDGSRVQGRAAGNMFLPAAGSRKGNVTSGPGQRTGWEGSVYSGYYGIASNDGINGNYWTSKSALGGATVLLFQNMSYSSQSSGTISTGVYPAKNSGSSTGGGLAISGAAVRCVPK